MKKKKVVLVHINPMGGVTPLVGGYLKTFAEQEEEIRSSWDIELYNTTTDSPASKIIRDLVLKEPDVIGFSLYVWNIGIIQRILPSLRGVLPPSTQYLLGGVQIMNSAEKYVDRTWENVATCNGEGERTFREYLLQLLDGSPDFGAIGGITFQRDGTYISTEAQTRIKHLDEIPSPFLAGLFQPGDLAVTLLETNRGCPYRCEYCFWGGAIGQKINRLPIERIREEIAFISSKRARSILLCDANFGIFPQDVEIARLFVESRQQSGYPLRVSYSSAKNKQERSVEIATIFARGGVLSCQPISLQTLNPDVLEMAKRQNIKAETYLGLQRSMNEQGVASYIELIWPLPGETVESFKQGVNELCRMGAQSFAIYPLLWLPNVGYEDKMEDLGVITLEEADPVGGGRVVIQTNEVTHAEWVHGMVFTNAVMWLYDCRGFYHTVGILNATGVASYRNVFDRFVEWMEDAPKNGAVNLWNEGRENFEEMYKNTWRGAMVEAALHGHRKEFDQIVKQFAEANPRWFEGERSHLLNSAVEFDLLTRPYAYANTPPGVGVDLEFLKILEVDEFKFVVESPFDFAAINHSLRTAGEFPPELLAPKTSIVTIDHARGQIFRMPHKRVEDHHQFCHQFVTEIGNSLPVCEVCQGEQASSR